MGEGRHGARLRVRRHGDETKMTESGKIYIATVLLEKNRWADGAAQKPTFTVSEWVERFAEAGFDGMELWEKHATLCSPEELAALQASAFPVAIFNSYASMGDEGAPARERAAQLTASFAARGVKFNVGKDPARRQEYAKNLAEWRSKFPPEVSLLCECHPGTIIEEPSDARAFFDEIGPDGYEVIVHPFSRVDVLKSWFEQFGPAVTHAHAQVRDDRKVVRLERKAEVVAEAIGIMREEGYAGSFTLEFAQGTGEPDENVEDLFGNAVADLEFLRGLLG